MLKGEQFGFPNFEYIDCPECSKPCGSGKRRISVKCKRGDEVVLDSKCPIELKPPVEEDCNTQACPEWVAGEFMNVLNFVILEKKQDHLNVKVEMK